MTNDQRKAPENGIWLCQNCAKLIDNDPGLFTISMLHSWKKVAEEVAKQRIGIRMPFDRTQSPEIFVHKESCGVQQSADYVLGSEANILASELFLLLPKYEEVSDVVLLNHGRGLHGQTYASLGVGMQYGWTWRIFFFVRSEFGWEIVAQLHFDNQKGNRPSVVYIPGSPGALAITHLAGYGTGIWYQTTSWYRISRSQPDSILSYPSRFYAFGWSPPFDRELSSTVLAMPVSLSGGEVLHLKFDVNYSIAERWLQVGESSILLKDTAELKLTWNVSAQAFIPLSSEDDASQVGDFWSMGTKDFVVKYRANLDRLALLGSPTQKNFIAAHLLS